MSIPSDTTKLNVCISSDDNDISNGSGSTTSGDQPLLKDPKERKRQRERDRYKQLCDQKKDVLLKSAVKLIDRGKLYLSRQSKLKQDVQMLGHIMQI
jgi:hypothetical protein